MAHLHNFFWVWKRGGLEKQAPATVAASLWTGTSSARVCRSDKKRCQSGNRSPVNMNVRVTHWPECMERLLQWDITGCLWKRFHMMGNPRGTTQLSFDIRFMKNNYSYELVLLRDSIKKIHKTISNLHMSYWLFESDWLSESFGAIADSLTEPPVIFWLCSILCYCGFY